MSDEDVIKYLASQSKPQSRPESRQTKATVRAPRGRRPPSPPDTFKEFSATHLFCPKCKQAMPVREKLLLYLPTGKLYDYCCERCGTSVGTRNAGL